MPRTPKRKSRAKPLHHAGSRDATNGAGRPGKRDGAEQAGPAGGRAHAPAGTREACRVRPQDTVIRTDPDLLPEQPRESHGLFELVPAVARRALVLGLSAREPSFHVFVAAEPEVMIEDDVVRYAARFSGARPTADDIVYVHDFDQPEAPRPLLLPSGQGPALVAAL